MKVFIFGSTGMLGRYVVSYLKKRDYHVIPITRNDVDILNVDPTALSNWFTLNEGLYMGDVVINCAGLIRQKISESDTMNAIKINSIFPHILNILCKSRYAEFIQISTDCCFSGERGYYYESDIPDATDIYGLSKAAGEPQDCSIIRTSIIGESKDDKSLLEWVRSQNGKTVDGFINHLWNGVTCLQLSKAIDTIIAKHIWWRGIRHYFSSRTNKAELVCNIATAYGINLSINYVNAPKDKNMLLLSNYTDVFKEGDVPDIYSQIREQKNYEL